MSQDIPYNFCGIPEEVSSLETSKIVILPVPFDATSTWIKGADKGPDAIIDASRNMELYDIETNSEVYKKGIHTAEKILAKTSSQMVASVEKKVSSLLNQKKFVVPIGGDHSISIGSIYAFAKQFKNLSILHLDAHTDTRDSYEGNKYSHASVMARSKEKIKKIVSVGIRSMDSSEKKNIEKGDIFFAEKIQGSKKWISQAVKKLSPNVYISIDLDAFDPSIMSSTGTPEPGGLGWYEVLSLLKTTAKNKNIVGFDIVELCPTKTNKAPDFLAAKLIYKLLSYVFIKY